MRAQRAASWCLLFGLIGLGISAYLMFLHLGLERGELLGGAFCGHSGPFDCHVVAASTWSALLGLPLALWGIMGYVVVIALALLARQSAEWAEQALTLLVLLATVFLAFDLLLLIVMIAVIRFFCLLCLLTYAVNFLVVRIAGRGLERSWMATLARTGSALGALVPSSRRPATWLFWGVVSAGLLGSLSLQAATTYATQGTLASLQQQLRQYVATQPRLGVPLSDEPMIGSPHAPVQIIEFSDFFCPACQRAARLNHLILPNHRQDAVFVFKNFPLDTTCNEKIGRMVHPGACQIAAAAECVHRQGKFWPFHDLVFEAGHQYQMAHLEADVQQLGVDIVRFRACLSSGEGMEAVKRDVAAADSVQVTSTPTYVINGVKVAGILTPSRFEDFIDAIRDSR